MDLREAVRAIQLVQSWNVESTTDLAAHVNAYKSPAGDLEAVPGLHGRMYQKPLHVLLALSIATRAHVKDDVLSAYQSWAIWRYLGAFEGAIGRPSYALTKSGQGVRGNQRRVMSEELGIGFSVKIAERWMNPAGDPDLVVRTVDIDDALSYAAGPWGHRRRQVKVQQIASRRPDYLVIADDPHSASKFRLGTLESKGTSAHDNTSQLRSGNEQLKGVLIGGELQPGLVVGTVLNGQGISSAALQLRRPNLPTDPVEVDLDSLNSGKSSPTDPRRSSRPKESLIKDALSASFANLSEISGNERAFDMWASESTKRRREFSGSTRNVESFESSLDNEPFVGTSLRIPLPGGSLTIFTGVGRGIAEALNTGSAARILEGQRSAKRRSERITADSQTPRSTSDRWVEAHSPDGAVAVIQADFSN